MNNNINQQLSSQAENQRPVTEKEITAYLIQKLSNQTNSIPQQNILREMLQNKEQGNSLLGNYVKNMCDNILKTNGKNSNYTNEELRKFFDLDGRNEVMAYLKNSSMDFDDDEIKKISTLVENIEKSAIDRYLKQKAREKNLQAENESAKQRLTSNAQNSGHTPIGNKIFTREQIGKMSSAEFAKNEKLIMEQLRQGLIQ